jgi:hypothetical protein
VELVAHMNEQPAQPFGEGGQRVVVDGLLPEHHHLVAHPQIADFPKRRVVKRRAEIDS